MKREEEKELSALLSRLLGSIHRLSPGQTQIVMEVDEHMRREELTQNDLDLLRSVERDADLQASMPE